jgi:antitoxin (DNA-binding transcriptional repressor) of toxin-antitoxin stability system
MMTIDVRLAKRQLSRIWQWVAAGEEIVISNPSRRIARLVRLALRRPRRPGLVVGRLTQEFLEPLPEDELAAWQQ